MEGLRWYDIKRWKAGNEYLSGKVRGASFVDENKLDTRKFEEARDYLWAVPISEINLNPNLAPNNRDMEINVYLNSLKTIEQ